MRFIIVAIIIYLVWKSLAKMLSSIEIKDPQKDKLRKQDHESQSRLQVNEDDIEDADFKDVD